METIARKPFQGVANIVRFNWHFYVIVGASFITLFLLTRFMPLYIADTLGIGVTLAALAVIVSLAASFYIYDCSGLYSLKWLDDLYLNTTGEIVNIHAGFDETSALLAQKYPQAHLRVFDFYDPAKHTEVSIKRARQAYPPYPGTEHINTAGQFLAPDSTDTIFAIFAAHEIRNTTERITFFNTLRKALKSKGRIVMAEHQRDFPNFLAYNIGFTHFLPPAEWAHTFKASGLTLLKEKHLTPFIKIYLLANGDAL